MTRIGTLVACGVLALGLVAAACGGDGDKDKDATPKPGATSAATAAKQHRAGQPPPPRSRAAHPQSGATSAAGGSTPTAQPTSGGQPAGKTYTAAEATAALDEIVLKPGDIAGTWNLATDTTTDNAAAKTADPVGAAGVDRCGRLLGRLTVNQAQDPVAAFLAGETLAFFSTITYYATEAGAIDCATEAAGRFAEPGALAKAFGALFINPDVVNVAQAQYPTVGDGSFAATLTGQINAQGNIIDLTLFIVAFRKGNMSAVVGSARSGSTPPSDEMKTYVISCSSA